MGSASNAAEALIHRITWLKHASFLYAGSVRIAFDPWEVTLDRPVDLVLVTHGHYDHCDPAAVTRLATAETTIVSAEACADQLAGNVRSLAPGGVLRVGDVIITATWAYNRSAPYHPRGEGVGFLVSVDEGTLFHAGDTDDIPETHGLKPDVALLPVGGTYTMDVAEAARAAVAIDPGIAIPMHYGFIVGSRQDGERFARELGDRARVVRPMVPFSR